MINKMKDFYHVKVQTEAQYIVTPSVPVQLSSCYRVTIAARPPEVTHLFLYVYLALNRGFCSNIITIDVNPGQFY